MVSSTQVVLLAVALLGAASSAVRGQVTVARSSLSIQLDFDTASTSPVAISSSADPMFRHATPSVPVYVFPRMTAGEPLAEGVQPEAFASASFMDTESVVGGDLRGLCPMVPASRVTVNATHELLYMMSDNRNDIFEMEVVREGVPSVPGPMMTLRQRHSFIPTFNARYQTARLIRGTNSLLACGYNDQDREKGVLSIFNLGNVSAHITEELPFRCRGLHMLENDPDRAAVIVSGQAPGDTSIYTFSISTFETTGSLASAQDGTMETGDMRPTRVSSLPNDRIILSTAHGGNPTGNTPIPWAGHAIYDISTPGNPILLSSFNVTQFSAFTDFNYATLIKPSPDGRWLAMARDRYVKFVDLADPSNPVIHNVTGHILDDQLTNLYWLGSGSSLLLANTRNNNRGAVALQVSSHVPPVIVEGPYHYPGTNQWVPVTAGMNLVLIRRCNGYATVLPDTVSVNVGIFARTNVRTEGGTATFEALADDGNNNNATATFEIIIDPENASSSPETADDGSMPLIIGIVVAGVLCLGLAAGVIFFVRRRASGGGSGAGTDYKSAGAGLPRQRTTSLPTVSAHATADLGEVSDSVSSSTDEGEVGAPAASGGGGEKNEYANLDMAAEDEGIEYASLNTFAPANDANFDEENERLDIRAAQASAAAMAAAEQRGVDEYAEAVPEGGATPGREEVEYADTLNAFG